MFLRLPSTARAVQWTGGNLAAMEALLGPKFDYSLSDGEIPEAGVLTSRHSAWQTIELNDWAVVEGDRVSVVEADEFAEQYAAGELRYEWRAFHENSGTAVWPIGDEQDVRAFIRRSAHPESYRFEWRLPGPWEQVAL